MGASKYTWYPIFDNFLYIHTLIKQKHKGVAPYIVKEIAGKGISQKLSFYVTLVCILDIYVHDTIVSNANGPIPYQLRIGPTYAA